MLHPDHETRIGAHQIFSVVLVPSSVSPQLDSHLLDSKKNAEFPRTLSRTVSVFSSSAALFEKLKKQRNNSKENLHELNKEKVPDDVNSTSGVFNRIKSSYSRTYSIRSSPAPDADSLTKSSREVVGPFVFLFLFNLSCMSFSIWLNMPGAID